MSTDYKTIQPSPVSPALGAEISGIDIAAGVDDEQNEVGQRNRSFALPAHARGNRAFRGLFKTCRIDQTDDAFADLGLALFPVAGQPRQIIDQREALSGDPVE